MIRAWHGKTFLTSVSIHCYVRVPEGFSSWFVCVTARVHDDVRVHNNMMWSVMWHVNDVVTVSDLEWDGSAAL